MPGVDEQYSGEQVSTELVDLGCRRDPGKRIRIANHISKLPVVQNAGPSISRAWGASTGKRAFDLFGALVLLILLLPLLLLIAVIVKLESRGPVFFKQRRTGFMGRRFPMFKFRTMIKDAEAMKENLRHLSHHASDSPDFKVVNDPRITRVGNILRKTSLDELPNLLNVVTGDMSLVGPRPTSFDFVTYQDGHLIRLAVKPGITGLWQISGRSELDFDERVALDRHYVEQQSFLFDLSILLKTPLKVIQAKGAH